VLSKGRKMKVCRTVMFTFDYVGVDLGLDSKGRTGCRKKYCTKQGESDRLEKVHTEELHGLRSSPNITRVVKSWKKRWAEHVACLVQKKN